MSIELSRITEKLDFGFQLFEQLTIFWTCKNIYLVFVFSSHCETFYMTVSDVNDVCSRILGQIQCTDEGRKLCKNVNRYNRSEFSVMTACRVFNIVGRMPHQFLSLVVNYTVVLLQFAFMHES
ncbi:uncharacterized protein LOC124641567 [Helicoverpa zea]|uniref:uncharacterized protein LOC124641567 n=1 Tax=Helicoverpa zea TaxID=7113 RepID=UPI001F56EEDA|nr:uncharacterized protein LOC124641567 [Helicoverpa zea]